VGGRAVPAERGAAFIFVRCAFAIRAPRSREWVFGAGGAGAVEGSCPSRGGHRAISLREVTERRRIARWEPDRSEVRERRSGDGIWRRRESNPRPEKWNGTPLHAQFLFDLGPALKEEPNAPTLPRIGVSGRAGGPCRTSPCLRRPFPARWARSGKDVTIT